MKKLILTLLIGAAAWFLWNLFAVPVKVTAVPAPSQGTPEPVETVKAVPISLPDSPVVRSSELVVLRGYVTEVADGVMIVDCERDPVKQGFAWNVDAGSGAAGIAQLAKLAADDSGKEVAKEFGPLKIVSNGNIRSVGTTPDERPIGRFAIYGYPERASRIHVVAAPTGTNYKGLPLYAATFTLRADTAASTPSSMFPPGVDTPEQRREYLKALGEARKNQRHSPNQLRRGARDRGH